MASPLQGKRAVIPDREVTMGPSISEAVRAAGADLVADNRDATAVQDLTGGTARIDGLLARLRANIALRFRRWREDRQTWAALRHLDDRQLKEFGIYPRPPDLAKSKFP